MAFQILSLSGGGYLGLYTATVLAEIEKSLGAPIASRFDLIAGTSIGGIIAIGLAHEIPASAIQGAFEENGAAIFSNRRAPKSGLAKFWDVLARSTFKPKYRSDGLRDTLTELLGRDTKLGHLKHPCFVTTVSLTKGGPQLFKTDHHPDFQRDLHLGAIDVALATSAAPTYFPIAKVGDGLYADGGLYANSPDLLALHEAEHFFGVNASDVNVLSIGTTTSKFSFSHETGTNFGLLRWALGQRLVQATLSSQQQITDFMLRHKLGDRYVRLDLQQSREQEQSLALDVATETARQTIRSMADTTVQAAVNDPKLRLILDHRAPPPRFYHRQNFDL
jgi:patatin-like phospholipase/acyl hydrolase